MPKQFTNEDLLTLTERTIKNMQYFGEISDEDVERWYDLTDAMDFFLSNYMYYDAQF